MKRKTKEWQLIVEIWNSVNFLFKEDEHIYKFKRQLSLEQAFCETPEGKMNGLHRGNDNKGDYYGWPNTGYDCPAYRLRRENVK